MSAPRDEDRPAIDESCAGIPTGFPLLDRALGGGLKGVRVIVVGARPSVGKTSFGQQIAESLSRAHEQKGAQ